MGEREARLEPQQIEHDIERLRARLGRILSELDHRRHALLSWPVLGGMALLTGGALALVLWMRRRSLRRLGRSLVDAAAVAATQVAIKAVAERFLLPPARRPRRAIVVRR
jgi:hypothetical protein